jgi:sporulation protein YlmC with PRC-barrel domain
LSEQNLAKSEETIGKTVVNMKAEKIGEVKDVAYYTSGKKSMIVSSPQGIDKIYSFDQAVAIKDVVLLDENKTSTTPLRTTTVPATQVPPRAPPVSMNQPPPIPRLDPKAGNTPSMTTKKCSSCGRDNRLQSKFCVRCGNRL